MKCKIKRRNLFILAGIIVLLGLSAVSAPLRAEDELEGELGLAFEDIENYTQKSRGGNIFVNILESIGKAIVGIIFSLVIALTLGFLSLAQLLFSWISDPGFLSVSFTGADNTFVYENWRLIRDLANIGIILGLVYTGLRTALDMSGPKTKQTLIRLIALAFLINFTPTLIGLAIDASHIAMDYFMIRGGKIDFAGMLGQSVMWIANPDTSILQSFVQLFALAASMFFVGVIYFILAFTFLVRYVMLWILVILSPLAFLAFAFPGGKKFWSQWWSNFISWTFLGIPVAFFLFLAAQMMEIIKDKVFWAGTSAKLSQALSLQTATGTQDAMPSETFYFVMPAALVYIGYMISLKLAPSVSNQIMGLTKGGFDKAKSWGWDQTKYRGAQTRDTVRQRNEGSHVFDTASRLGIATHGWDDRGTNHYARHRVAQEIMKSSGATSIEKAHASRYLSVTEKMEKRKIEHSHFRKKLQETDPEKLTAMVYDPRVNPEKTAAAMHELLSSHEDTALKTLGSLNLPEDAAVRTFTALLQQGNESDAKKFAISQSGKHGAAIDAQAIALGIKKAGESYSQESLAKVDQKGATLVADVFKSALKDKPTTAAERTAYVDRINYIVDAMLGGKREVNRDIIKSMSPTEQKVFAMKFRTRADTLGRLNDPSVKATLNAWRNQGYV